MKSSDRTRVDWKAILGLGVIVLLVMFGWPKLQQQLIQEPAPDFSYETLTGEVSSLQAGLEQPVILHFWATWCQVCLFELPELKKIEQQFKVLNIASDSGLDQDVIKHAEQHQMLKANIINDVNRSIVEAYGVIGFPTTVIVDIDGMVRFKKVGKVTATQVSAAIK